MKPAPPKMDRCGRSGAYRMRIHRETTVHGIARFRVIVAPTVRPDPGRAQRARTGAENDAKRLVIQYKRQTGHDLARYGLCVAPIEGKTKTTPQLCLTCCRIDS